MDFTAMSQRKQPGQYTRAFCDYPRIVVYLGINLTENTKGHQFNYDPSVMIILMDMMSIDLSSNYLTGEVAYTHHVKFESLAKPLQWKCTQQDWD